jgi:hypothetical protein
MRRRQSEYAVEGKIGAGRFKFVWVGPRSAGRIWAGGGRSRCRRSGTLLPAPVLWGVGTNHSAWQAKVRIVCCSPVEGGECRGGTGGLLVSDRTSMRAPERLLEDGWFVRG